jgi:hypothetical protein
MERLGMSHTMLFRTLRNLPKLAQELMCRLHDPITHHTTIERRIHSTHIWLPPGRTQSVCLSYLQRKGKR